MFPLCNDGDFGFDPNFSFSFSHLPLCDLLEFSDCEAFLIQQQKKPDPTQKHLPESGSAMNCCSKVDEGGCPPRKRSSKRDRHSKIVTARGMRDRRMRLSLEVAKKFFGLQDLLGYEKASKTVEWLLLQANAEIKKLSRSLSMANPVGCRVANVAEREDDCSNKRSKSSAKGNKSSSSSSSRKVRKTAFRAMARDQRAKARERAKARTRAKMRSRECEGSKPQNEANHLFSWNCLETAGEESAGSIINNLQVDDAETFVIMTNPNSIFSCLQNDAIPQEHQLIHDLQSLGNHGRPITITTSYATYENNFS